MGKAKRSGTFEERKARAIARKQQEELDNKTNVACLKPTTNIPPTKQTLYRRNSPLSTMMLVASIISLKNK